VGLGAELAELLQRDDLGVCLRRLQDREHRREREAEVLGDLEDRALGTEERGDEEVGGFAVVVLGHRVNVRGVARAAR